MSEEDSNASTCEEDGSSLEYETIDFCKNCEHFLPEGCEVWHHKHDKCTFTKTEYDNIARVEDKMIHKVRELHTLTERLASEHSLHRDLHLKVCQLKTSCVSKLKTENMEPNEKVVFASWSMENCKDDETIKEMASVFNKEPFEIVALQDTGKDAEAAMKLVAMVNDDEDSRWKWKTYTKINDKDFHTKSPSTFMWKVNDTIQLENVVALNHLGNFSVTPILGIFTSVDWKFALLNFNLTSPKGDKKVSHKEIEHLWIPYTEAKRICKDYGVEKEDIILVGDFQCIPYCIRELEEQGFTELFSRGDYTNADATEPLDNFVVHYNVKHRCWGHGIQNSLPASKEKKRKFHSPRRAIWATFLQ